MSSKKKLLADDKLREEYSDFMKIMRDRVFVKEVPQEEINPDHRRVWFLTHHVIRHRKKGKLRIVSDCSLEFNGVLLNNTLRKGPDLTNSLVGVLMRFRENMLAVSGDIEKMYHQVEVPKEDRTFLLFWWFPNANQHWLKVHLFGATSSSSVASYAPRKCLETDILKNKVQSCFYVDDLLISFENEEEGALTIQKLCSSLKSASCNLTSFASNSQKILCKIPEKNLSKIGTKIEIADVKSSNVKALGMTWNNAEDTLGFDFNLPNQPDTRRGVLSSIFSIYDPFFLASPAFIRAKRIFQATCDEKLKWDDILPDHLLEP